MKLFRFIALLLFWAPAVASAQTGTPASNAFTFQGFLQFGNQPVDIELEMTFQLFANPTGNGINDVVSPQLTRTVQFDNRGRFSVLLDFGDTFNGFPIFNGDERYMQIVILDPPGGLEEDIPLSPRTKLDAAPLAAYALNARIPSLSEITDGRLVSTDTLGNLSLIPGDDNVGLSVGSGSFQTKYSQEQIEASDAFSINAADTLALQSETGDVSVTSTQGNMHLNAGSGNIDLISNKFAVVNDDSTLSLDQSVFELDVSFINIDSQATTTIDSGGNIELNAAAVLNLNSSLTHINGNQFDSVNVIINRDLLATGNAFKPGGGPWASLSDRRQKKNIAPLHGSLQTLLSLRPVTFEYIDPANPMCLAGVQTGFVAQQVQPILPAWVDQNDDGTLMLTPRGFEAMAVDAMQEQQQQIDALQRENDELRARLDRLESVMRTLVAPE